MRRIGWHLAVGRREPGWRERLATFEAVARLDGAALAGRTATVLDAHLRHAVAAFPFYRGKVASGAPLGAFPILSRHDFQVHRETLRDATRPVAALREETSGGSTGEPVRLWNDADYALSTFATEAYVLGTWGLRPWSRRAFLWGDDREQKDVGWKERVARRIHPTLFLNAFGMDEARMASFADRMEAFRPELVQGYATALDLFASYLLAKGRRAVRPVAVRSSAEALLPASRARIEEAFGAPVRDFYGSRESSSLAAQCAHGGFHVLAHGRVLEIVDDLGAPCGPGVPGRILVTDLTNQAFAVIRYENGDVAAWSADPAPCACGCAYPRLDRVHGRTSDFLTTPRGERIHGEWFTHLFYGRDGVERFQVRQRALDAVEVLTVGRATAADVEPLLRKMRDRLGAGVTVAWRAVDDIPLTRSGKHRFTVSDVPFLPVRP